MGKVIFVTGGARSGKSRYAEQRAVQLGAPVVYVATMEPRDDEVRARIAAHQRRRPSHWKTIEAPFDVEAALGSVPSPATVLLDCLSLWVANILLRECEPQAGLPVERWEAAVTQCVAGAESVVAAQARRTGVLITVTNEVGLGIVPEGQMSRYYRDALGLVNQAFADEADEAVLMVSGRHLSLGRGLARR